MPATFAVSANSTRGTDRRIEVPWTHLKNDAVDAICRAIVDSNTDNPVQAVDLMDNELGPTQAHKLALSMESSAVREVLLRYNDIGKAGCDGLAGAISVSSKIQSIDIQGNHLSHTDAHKLLRAVGGSTSLTRLGMSKNNLGPEGATLISKALEKNTYLTYLDLSLNEIGPTGAEVIARLLGNPASTLQHVNLYGNYLGAIGVRHVCDAMRNNKEVRILCLGNNNATDAAAEGIATMLHANGTLESLDLRFNSLTAAAVKPIAQEGIKANTSLTSLCLAGNPIGAVGMETIAHTLIAHQRNSLTQLDLSSCELGPAGGMRLANLLGSSITLREVNLSENGLDDDTAVALAENVATSISLSQLDVCCNKIGELGASRLIDAVQLNPHLTCLTLHGNNISRVVQKKIDNLLEERIARNRVHKAHATLQLQQKVNRLENHVAPVTV